MAKTPLDDLAPLEAAFRAAFFGRFKGGIFGQVREPPPEVVALAAAGNADAIIDGPWWAEIWGDPKADELEGAAETIDRHLRRISREAGFAAFREITPERERAASLLCPPPWVRFEDIGPQFDERYPEALAQTRAHQRRGLPEREAGRLAEKLAKRRAAALVRSVRRATEAGLRVTVKTIHELAEAGATKLAAELEARLGPTRAQAARIRRWERAERRKGTPAESIRLGALSRSRNAVRSRADEISRHHFAAAVGESRMIVFKNGAMLVHSQDQRDERVRKLHREQTKKTKANPVPAGEPYVNAPFPGPVPYQRGCR